MKRNIFGIYLCAMALLGLLLVSCDKNLTSETNYLDVPVITASDMTVAADGGSYTLTYSVTNAVSGATVSCTADVSWITDINASTSGAISFTADKNTGDDIRAANLTISYSYTNEAGSGLVSEAVGIIQNGQATPVLNLQPNAVAATYLGGSYSFAYMIDNPADDGELYCYTSADWIINFDYSTEGTVKFVVVDNSDGEELRSATITVTYEYAETSVSKEVTVVQDHPEVENIDLGDLVDVIGKYTGHANLFGQEYEGEEGEWTIRIYYNPSEEYDIYLDGLLPWGEGAYEYYQSHMYSAEGYYRDGQIIVPSQVLSTQITVSLFYHYFLAFTPCTGFDVSGTFYYDGTNFPDLVMTLDPSTGIWSNGDYGELLCGCSVSGTLSSIATGFQASAPGFYMTRISEDPASIESDEIVIHPLTELYGAIAK